MKTARTPNGLVVPPQFVKLGDNNANEFAKIQRQMSEKIGAFIRDSMVQFLSPDLVKLIDNYGAHPVYGETSRAMVRQLGFAATRSEVEGGFDVTTYIVSRTKDRTENLIGKLEIRYAENRIDFTTKFVRDTGPVKILPSHPVVARWLRSIAPVDELAQVLYDTRFANAGIDLANGESETVVTDQQPTGPINNFKMGDSVGIKLNPSETTIGADQSGSELGSTPSDNK